MCDWVHMLPGLLFFVLPMGCDPGLHREFVDTRGNTPANREELVDSKTKSADDFFFSKLVNIFS